MENEIKKFEPFEATEQGVATALEKMRADIEADTNFDFIRQLEMALPEAEVYVVGGAVRDAIRGLETHDYDFVVTHCSQEDLEAYLKSGGRILAESNVQTAVYKFKPGENADVVDVALPRRERYTQESRTPTVDTENVDISDDLARRDFTINSMAYKLAGNDSELVDPFGGVDDINNRKIRAVGNASERFREDPLRLMRAARFALKLDYDIDSDTLTAIRENAGLITAKSGVSGKSIVSAERVAKELCDALEASPRRFLPLLSEMDLLKYILPEIETERDVAQSPQYHSEGDVFVHTQRVMENLPLHSPLGLCLAGIFHDAGKPGSYDDSEGKIHFRGHAKLSQQIAQASMSELKLPKALIEDVSWLVSNHMILMSDFCKMKWNRQRQYLADPRLNQLFTLTIADAKASLRPDGSSDLDFVRHINAAIKKYDQEKRQNKPEQIIDGDEIIGLIQTIQPDFDPKKHGKIIGRIKNEINTDYHNGIIKNKAEAEKKIIQILADINSS